MKCFGKLQLNLQIDKHYELQLTNKQICVHLLREVEVVKINYTICSIVE